MSEVGLIKYDAMCRAIAACHRVDEAKELRNKARALEVYAHQAKNLDAEQQAAEIRIRAERQTGILLREAAQNGQRQKQGGDQKSKSRDTSLIPNLKDDLKISPDESSKWQQLAVIPQEQFDEA